MLNSAEYKQLACIDAFAWSVSSRESEGLLFQHITQLASG